MAHACTRVAPARIAAIVLITDMPRSEWPCQSMPTRTPLSWTTSCVKPSRLRTPDGVAWPTVSHRQSRRAPHSIAVRKSRRSVAGCARIVSSVTYITSSPFEAANVTASRVCCSIISSVQFSAYWRIGDEPMNVHTSIGRPTFCDTSTMGSMSRTIVRAAQLALMRSFEPTISCASRVTSRTTCGPAPGSPMSAVSMPSRSMRWSNSIFSSMLGVRTDGDCSPSRSVSSSNWIRKGGWSQTSPARFQS